MRIFSWNINGIEPFLQTPIPKYMQAAKPKANSPCNTLAPPIPPPSLPAFLHRHKWPCSSVI